MDSEATPNPAGNGQVDEAGQQTGETRRVGCRWAAERMGGGHTGLRGDLGTHCKHVLTARFPSPFRESEVLMGWAGLGLVWSPKRPSASFVEVGCLAPSLSLHPNLDRHHRLCGEPTSFPISLWFPSQEPWMPHSHGLVFRFTTALLVLPMPSSLLPSDHIP